MGEPLTLMYVSRLKVQLLEMRTAPTQAAREGTVGHSDEFAVLLVATEH